MESKNTHSACQRWLIPLLLIVAVVWFGNIEYRKLIRPDEGRYAEIPREMVQSGDWVTPRLNDLKYFEKPPMQYWATATAYEAFGEHQWTSRLWCSLTGFMGMLLVWFTGARLFGRAAGTYAAILLGGSLFYVLMAHINTLDMGVTFFVTLGICALLLAQHERVDMLIRRNWMMLAWAALAFAVLSKGLMGIILPGTALFLYALAQRDFSVLKRMHWVAGLLLFFAIATPWFYLVIKANPEFFQRFFIYEHFTRFTTKQLGRYQPWYYFIPVLLVGMLPWTLLMFDAAVRTWREPRADKGVFSPERFLLVWVAFIYVFFSFSGSKLPSYLLPMYPPLALIMGRQIAALSEKRLIWLIAPMLPLGLIGLAYTPFVVKNADTPLQAVMYGNYAAWLAAAALVWLAGIVAALVWLRRGKKCVAIAALSFATLVTAQLGTSGYNTIAPERSAYDLAEAIRGQIKPDVPFYSVGMYEQTLPFYLKRTFTLVDYQDEMDFGIAQEPWRYLPSVQDFVTAWQKLPEAYAIMPVYMAPRLEAQGLTMKTLYQDTQYKVVAK
jgi:4-amino-4-deoxy-L-arabinose transferase-like glycosyltransferase